MKRIAACLGFLLLASLSFSQEKPKNLGTLINTSYNEAKPIISPDGKRLYFARQNYPQNYDGEADDQDIYYSVNVNGNWQLARNAGEPLNDEYVNGVSSVSSDGLSLLVINGYDQYGDLIEGPAISTKRGNQWSVARPLSIKEFYNLNDYVDYFISSSGRVMLMAIEQEDTNGDQDLYVSFKIDQYTWSKPINMGPVLNSAAPEFSPFLAADNKTLFFASFGHNSVGSSDIFYSKRLDDSWQNWSKPENLGADVNTKEFEGYYTIAANGEDAYFVSSKGGMGGSRDIFQMVLPYKFRPDPVLLMQGKVVNVSNAQQLDAKISFKPTLAVSEEKMLRSSAEDGFSQVLEGGELYKLSIEKTGYFSPSQHINLANLEAYREETVSLPTYPIQKGSIIPFHYLSFATNSDFFKADAYSSLDKLYGLLEKNNGLKIKITAYSSTLNSEADNLSLSLNRAKAVKEFLEDKGVFHDRIEVSAGGNNPFNSPYNFFLKPGYSKNERVEIEILEVDWVKPAPKDTDGDGIIDEEDNCITVAGVTENNGCPEIAEETKKVFEEALQGIEFESGRDVIRAVSFPILDKVVQVMNDNPDYKLKISGHTDSMGDDESNLILSHKRANATKQYLIDNGIAMERLDAVGYGESKPVEDNSTEFGRSKNRRVEFEVIFE